MHAQFLFLLTADSLRVPDKQLLHDVLGQFYVLYAEDFCGPDNGCNEQIIVCQDGRVINCVQDNHYREHKQWCQELMNQSPAERWTQAIQQAYSVAAKSLRRDRPFQNAKEMVSYANYVSRVIVPNLCRYGDAMSRQHARDLLEAVEAIESVEFAPFSTLPDTPYYNWRLWDLRDPETSPALLPEDVILFVDIHL
jgi:hypothetical protein